MFPQHFEVLCPMVSNTELVSSGYQFRIVNVGHMDPNLGLG